MIDGRRGGFLRRWEDVQAERRMGRAPTLYGDKVLTANRPDYDQFLRDEIARGVFRLGRRCREQVRAFFVGKKDGQLRFILDCRRSNMHFTEPPRTALYSAASAGDAETYEGAELFFS